MQFTFEQPNLDGARESHIYFDRGDGRPITIFTREDREDRAIGEANFADAIEMIVARSRRSPSNDRPAYNRWVRSRTQ